MKVLDGSSGNSVAAVCWCIPCRCNCSGQLLTDLNTTNDYNGGVAYIDAAVYYYAGCSC